MPTLRIKDLFEDRYLAFDLKDLLLVLGHEAGDLSWKCDVEWCIAVDDTATLEDQFNGPSAIKGDDLLELAVNTRQVVDGVFEGCKAGSRTPWVKLEAIDSSYWEVTADEVVIDRFRRHFRNVEVVA